MKKWKQAFIAFILACTSQTAAADNKQITYSGNLSLLEHDLGKLTNKALKIVGKNRGYFQKISDRNLTFRVPTKRFGSVMEKLAALGLVKGEHVSHTDYKGEVIKLEAKIKSKRTMLDMYMAIMNKASSMKEMMAAEREIGSLIREIEHHTGRLRFVNHRIAYSTISLDFNKASKKTIDNLASAKIPWINSVGVQDIFGPTIYGDRHTTAVAEKVRHNKTNLKEDYEDYGDDHGYDYGDDYGYSH